MKFQDYHLYAFQFCSGQEKKMTKGHTLMSKLNRVKILVHYNIGIKHGFSYINVCQIPREMLKTEAEGRGFQQLPRDLTNVNALENNV